LEIIFDEKDYSLAYFIKKRVGYGRVISEDSARYLLEHPQGLKTLLTLINGKFFTANITDQLLNNEYDQKYEITILPPTDFDIKKKPFSSGILRFSRLFQY
jgi:hypothetical protein